MTLLDAVRALLQSDLPDNPGAFLTDGAHEDLPTVVADVVEAACGELIADGGRPNFAAMRQLEKDVPGVRVGPGETDSFGWLSGVVYTPKGEVVYG